MSRSLLLFGLGITTAFLTGCATEQPQWLTKAPAAECLSEITPQCLSALASQRIGASAPSIERDQTVLQLIAVSRAGALELPDELTKEPSAMDKALYESLKVSAVDAGAAIRLMLDGKDTEAVEAAHAIADKDARIFALLGIVSLSDGSMDEGALGKALNTLYGQDSKAYARGLHGRLVGLLNKGDIERALALGRHMMKIHYDQSSQSFAPFASIAATYAAAGLKGDAHKLVRDAVIFIPVLGADDNSRFFSIAMKAADGHYPPPQDFHDLTSDQVRLDAYLQLAANFRRTGNKEMSARALSDVAGALIARGIDPRSHRRLERNALRLATENTSEAVFPR